MSGYDDGGRRAPKTPWRSLKSIASKVTGITNKKSSEDEQEDNDRTDVGSGAPPAAVGVPANVGVFGVGSSKKGGPGGVLALAGFDDDSGDEWSEEEEEVPAPAPAKKQPVPAPAPSKQPAVASRVTGGAGFSFRDQTLDDSDEEAETTRAPARVAAVSKPPVAAAAPSKANGFSFRDPTLDESDDDDSSAAPAPAPVKPAPAPAPQPQQAVSKSITTGGGFNFKDPSLDDSDSDDDYGGVPARAPAVAAPQAGHPVPGIPVSVPSTPLQPSVASAAQQSQAQAVDPYSVMSDEDIELAKLLEAEGLLPSGSSTVGGVFGVAAKQSQQQPAGKPAMAGAGAGKDSSSASRRDSMASIRSVSSVSSLKPAAGSAAAAAIVSAADVTLPASPAVQLGTSASGGSAWATASAAAGGRRGRSDSVTSTASIGTGIAGAPAVAASAAAPLPRARTPSVSFAAPAAVTASTPRAASTPATDVLTIVAPPPSAASVMPNRTPAASVSSTSSAFALTLPTAQPALAAGLASSTGGSTAASASTSASASAGGPMVLLPVLQPDGTQILMPVPLSQIANMSNNGGFVGGATGVLQAARPAAASASSTASYSALTASVLASLAPAASATVGNGGIVGASNAKPAVSVPMTSSGSGRSGSITAADGSSRPKAGSTSRSGSASASVPPKVVFAPWRPPQSVTSGTASHFHNTTAASVSISSSAVNPTAAASAVSSIAAFVPASPATNISSACLLDTTASILGPQNDGGFGVASQVSVAAVGDTAAGGTTAGHAIASASASASATAGADFAIRSLSLAAQGDPLLEASVSRILQRRAARRGSAAPSAVSTGSLQASSSSAAQQPTASAAAPVAPAVSASAAAATTAAAHGGVAFGARRSSIAVVSAPGPGLDVPGMPPTTHLHAPPVGSTSAVHLPPPPQLSGGAPHAAGAGGGLDLTKDHDKRRAEAEAVQSAMAARYKALQAKREAMAEQLTAKAVPQPTTTTVALPNDALMIPVQTVLVAPPTPVAVPMPQHPATPTAVLSSHALTPSAVPPPPTQAIAFARRNPAEVAAAMGQRLKAALVTGPPLTPQPEPLPAPAPVPVQAEQHPAVPSTTHAEQHQLTGADRAPSTLSPGVSKASTVLGNVQAASSSQPASATAPTQLARAQRVASPAAAAVPGHKASSATIPSSSSTIRRASANTPSKASSINTTSLGSPHQQGPSLPTPQPVQPAPLQLAADASFTAAVASVVAPAASAARVLLQGMPVSIAGYIAEAVFVTSSREGFDGVEDGSQWGNAAGGGTGSRKAVTSAPVNAAVLAPVSAHLLLPILETLSLLPVPTSSGPHPDLHMLRPHAQQQQHYQPSAQVLPFDRPCAVLHRDQLAFVKVASDGRTLTWHTALPGQTAAHFAASALMGGLNNAAGGVGERTGEVPLFAITSIDCLPATSARNGASSAQAFPFRFEVKAQVAVPLSLVSASAGATSVFGRLAAVLAASPSPAPSAATHLSACITMAFGCMQGKDRDGLMAGIALMRAICPAPPIAAVVAAIPPIDSTLPTTFVDGADHNRNGSAPSSARSSPGSLSSSTAGTAAGAANVLTRPPQTLAEHAAWLKAFASSDMNNSGDTDASGGDDDEDIDTANSSIIFEGGAHDNNDDDAPDDTASRATAAPQQQRFEYGSVPLMSSDFGSASAVPSLAASASSTSAVSQQQQHATLPTLSGAIYSPFQSDVTAFVNHHDSVTYPSVPTPTASGAGGLATAAPPSSVPDPGIASLGVPPPSLDRPRADMSIRPGSALMGGAGNGAASIDRSTVLPLVPTRQPPSTPGISVAAVRLATVGPANAPGIHMHAPPMQSAVGPASTMTMMSAAASAPSYTQYQHGRRPSTYSTTFGGPASMTTTTTSAVSRPSITGTVTLPQPTEVRIHASRLGRAVADISANTDAIAANIARLGQQQQSNSRPGTPTRVSGAANAGSVGVPSSFPTSVSASQLSSAVLGGTSSFGHYAPAHSVYGGTVPSGAAASSRVPPASSLTSVPPPPRPMALSLTFNAHHQSLGHQAPSAGVGGRDAAGMYTSLRASAGAPALRTPAASNGVGVNVGPAGYSRRNSVMIMDEGLPSTAAMMVR